jgi:hypothetical protein
MLIRESARAVIVDESHRILLRRVSPLGSERDQKAFWVTLGVPEARGRPRSSFGTRTPREARTANLQNWI